MTSRVHSCIGPGWDLAVKDHHDADVFFSSGWHQAGVVALGDGDAELFEYAMDGDRLIHPFIRRAVPGTEWSDIESAYGYAGPLSTTRRPEFIAAAWESYLENGQGRIQL